MAYLGFRALVGSGALRRDNVTDKRLIESCAAAELQGWAVLSSKRLTIWTGNAPESGVIPRRKPQGSCLSFFAHLGTRPLLCRTQRVNHQSEGLTGLWSLGFRV